MATAPTLTVRLLAEQRRRQAEQLLQVARPAAGDDRGTERELEDQVPADDPGDDLADGGVGVGVGAAGRRHAGGHLGVAEGGQQGDHAGDGEGDDDAGAGAVLGLDAGEREDAGADDDADAEAHEVERAEPPLESSRAARAAACPSSSSPPWARTSSTGLVRSIECPLMGTTVSPPRRRHLPGSVPAADGPGVKGWAHDTALRVVRRPERRQPAALLGRRGVDQPRRAEEVTHGRAVPASGRPPRSPAPRRTAARAARARQDAARRQGRTGSSAVAPPWQGVQLGRPSRPPPTASSCPAGGGASPPGSSTG